MIRTFWGLGFICLRWRAPHNWFPRHVAVAGPYHQPRHSVNRFQYGFNMCLQHFTVLFLDSGSDRWWMHILIFSISPPWLPPYWRVGRTCCQTVQHLALHVDLQSVASGPPWWNDGFDASRPGLPRTERASRWFSPPSLASALNQWFPIGFRYKPGGFRSQLTDF